jgi:hypothetical protein
MSKLFEVVNVSVSIARSRDEVYAFASDGANMPKWATGLAGESMRKVDGEWIAEGPLGTVKVKFVPRNDFGVLDHDVHLPSGDVVHNPVRIIPNGDGCTVIFTLLKLPGVTKEKLDEDTTWVEKDLTKLKELLEKA